MVHGHKWEFNFATQSTSKVDFHPGNTPKVLGIGALVKRDNVLFVPRNTFRRRTLRLTFPRMTWRGWEKESFSGVAWELRGNASSQISSKTTWDMWVRG